LLSMDCFGGILWIPSELPLLLLSMDCFRRDLVDPVRTALAKGVSKPVVLFKHVLKNAMIPILTSVVMAIPFLYTGSLLLESFFGIPGLGTMGVNGINASDFDVIRALVLVGAGIYVVANLLTDICYAAVDPRVRLG